MRSPPSSLHVLLAILAPMLPASAAALDLTTTGSWSRTITAADLRSGAGSDLYDTQESSTDEVTLDISSATGAGDQWRVDVHRLDATWPSGVHLWVRRTGDGSGSGSISGGASYHEITTSDSEFFSGFGDRSDINLQFRITGMSLSVPPDAYSSSVSYTVVDI
jgi:hypothetical protein